MEYVHQILLAYTVLHSLETGIQIKDNASPSIVNHMVYFDQTLLTHTV